MRRVGPDEGFADGGFSSRVTARADEHTGVQSEFVAGSVTIVTSTLTIVLGKYFEGRRQAEAALRDRKIDVYDTFVSKLFNLFGGGEEPIAGDDLVPFLRETQRKLLLWSGPHVLNAYGKWNRSMRTNPADPQAKVLLEMVDFFLALRDDLGLSNHGLQREYLGGVTPPGTGIVYGDAPKRP